MNTEDLYRTATANFKRHLEENIYPGRGIIIGCDPNGDFLLIYWIMGRSANSRNRVFINTGDGLRTEVADPSCLIDPSLIIYNAICKTPQGFLVTNGDQTDRIQKAMVEGRSFEDSLIEEKHEPDAPNFTPRIAGLLNFSSKSPSLKLGIARRSVFSENYSEHRFFHFTDLKPAFGFGISTYKGDGNPLPSYDESPLLFPLDDTLEKLSERYWEALDHDNRVSLALMKIDNHGFSSECDICNSRIQVP